MTSMALSVLAGFGYSLTDDDITWTDITPWLDLKTGVSITRGASDELQQTQTGTCTFRLDNEDGRFTPGRAASPYFPYVRKRCPIWIRQTSLSGTNWITNPGFENDSNGWARGTVQPLGFGTDDTHAHSGVEGCIVQWAPEATGGTIDTHLYGLSAGTTYTASAYVYVEAANPAVRLQVDDGATLGALSTVTGAFTRITVTFTATSVHHVLQVTTGTTSPVTGNRCWFDDVLVNEGASALTFDPNPATVHDRFFGGIASLPTDWQGLMSTVTVTCNDVFAFLARQSNLQPMVVEEVLLTGPVVYYPLSEAEGSTSGGDVSGAGQQSLAVAQLGSGGTLTFGQGTGPSTDGLSTPVFTPSSATAGKFLTAHMTGSNLTGEGGVEGPYAFECWFSTTTKGRVLMAWTTNDAAAFASGTTFLLDATTGHLVLEHTDGGSFSTVTLSTPNLADGLVHHLVWDDRQGFFGTDQAAYIDGVQYSAVINPAFHVGVVTVGSDYLGGRLWSGSISHVAAYVDTSGFAIPTSTWTDHYTAGVSAFSGEDSDARMQRLAAYGGIITVNTFGDFSPVTGQGELGQNVMSHMRDIERTESGKLIASRGAAGLDFYSRTVRYNPTAAITLDWADTETDSNQFSDDDQKLINTAAASRPGGATQRVTNQASVDAYGPYDPGDQTLYKTTDAEVVDALNWETSRYGDPPPELRTLTVEAYTMDAATYAALLAADISTVIGLTGLPDQAPTPTASVFVEGYTETITVNRHVLAFHTSRADTDTVWVLDDPSYSVLGSTTRLAY